MYNFNESNRIDSTDKLKKLSTLVEYLHYRGQYQPDRQAYIFLQNGETESGSLTYGQLDRQARMIAAYLQSWQGERALLLYPSGLEFITAFFGCLLAGVVAVPIYPPRRNQKLSRLLSIANDAQAKIALTTTSILADIEKRWEEEAELAQLKLIATDTIETNPQEFVPKSVIPESLAFLQYTSGSTGTPKGVMVTHENLIQTSTDLDRGWEHNSDSVIVTWLPTFHDMGLVYGMLQSIYKGCKCIMMPPVAFIKKPILWLKAISDYQGTHSGAPNFAYALCVEKTTPEQRNQLDLSSWSMALNGAEPVRADVLEKFAQAFEVSGFNRRAFCPGYGMAEATLKISAVCARDKPTYLHIDATALEQNYVVEVPDEKHLGKRTLVGCGRSKIDTKIIIVNPQTCYRSASEEIGEIWASGGSIASGYWNRTEETQETFQAYLKDTGEGPFLRTGDLGFFRNGELFVIGRIKDLIIIRGQNYYPQDIEMTVQKSHPSLRLNCGAAFTVEVKGEEKLVIVQEVERIYLRKLNVQEVVGNIIQAVTAQHGLQVYATVLVKTASIPKTSSGKIQRHACKIGFLNRSLNAVEDWSEDPRRKASHRYLHTDIESLFEKVQAGKSS